MARAVRPVRTRRSQERAALTRKKLVNVAVRLFAERGFDGVTVREIEVQAGVQRNLLQYHFGGKDEIWKAAVMQMISRFQAFTDKRWELVRDMSPHERAAYTIRSYVRFAAEVPNFNRMMIQEGKRDSWRLRWLEESFIQPSLSTLKGIAMDDLKMSDEEFPHWYYMLAGGGALMFAMAPEAKMLFGVDVTEDELIDRHAKMMVDILLSRTNS